MSMNVMPAPALITSSWLNSDKPLDIPDFRGRVLVIEAFQMLCPGCVAQSLPQAQRILQTFRGEQVAVIGLHTVFEHHDVQGTRAALAAFAHENRLNFPIGIDQQVRAGQLPATMAAYNMQGTPTTVVIDRNGMRRFQRFGHVDDLTLGHIIGTLSQEPVSGSSPSIPEDGCTADGCPVPARA
jgi:peroxiredoxin